MSATYELRRLLDERGARWTACSKATIDNQTYCYGHTYTEFQAGLMVSDLTPEQAVAATLGAGTCREVKIDHYWRGCGECGYVWEFMYGIGKCERPCYCPNCGRRVVE